MILIGSTTSPYVRRLRMWMSDIEHEFEEVDIFNSADRSRLVARNPTLKVPMLDDNATIVLDSGVIFRYLTNKFNKAPLSWEQENLMTLIDSANDSLVQIFLLSRSDIDTSADKLYFRLQRERFDMVFAELDKAVSEGAFSDWNYASISLYCLLDWVEFRSRYDFSRLAHLVTFHQTYSQSDQAIATDPR
ncbi:glutathione S-transferase family protein [Glaciecola sp. MH2013]|uniref:glutathione S-transferase family protein n=1 Tax=Glaciecola sp. MH2013 TaxID=2785524 RepID=UPI0018A0AB35|nr:glutathione S-transferase family protein [Glaciecola sp. MH2013]MBF7073814.1 glutathione S-transferase family protein [Glaciecola sp. MH2013]